MLWCENPGILLGIVFDREQTKSSYKGDKGVARAGKFSDKWWSLMSQKVYNSDMLSMAKLDTSYILMINFPDPFTSV